jgi:hypothetical protein
MIHPAYNILVSTAQKTLFRTVVLLLLHMAVTSTAQRTPTPLALFMAIT